jgi:HAD superfamily hydrolase (TIGR01509 family)
MKTDKCVIFDFDGVIFDSEGINYAANQLAFKDAGLSFSAEEYKQLWIVEGLDLPDIISRYQLNVNPEEIRRRKNLYSKEMLMSIQKGISDEVRNTIEILIVRKWKIAIGSSNSEDNIRSLLEKSNIRQKFNAIVGLESVRKVKPAPDVFIECLKRTGVSAENAVVIEDAPKGVLAAKRAKIGKVIAVPNNWTKDCDFSNADLILDSLQNLPESIL